MKVNKPILCRRVREEEYSRMFITSDEHYGSERTLTLSRRPFDNTVTMDKEMIKRFNSKVPENGITIHNGDFGNMELLKELNGEHILIWGNYEMVDFLNDPNSGRELPHYPREFLENSNKWDFVRQTDPKMWSTILDIVTQPMRVFNEYLKHKYGWKEVYPSFPIPIIAFMVESNMTANYTLPTKVIRVTHKPEDCDKSEFNLYGHIHGRQLVKTYGLDVGVDGHHFYPLSLKDDVSFFKTAIEEHYDDNVFE